MRILIASDLHGSLESLSFLQSKAEQLNPDLILLLGDLVYHGPRNPLPAQYDTIKLLDHMPALMQLPSPVMAVRGNCDGEVDMGLLPFSMPESAWIEADGFEMFASHGHKLPDTPPFKNLPAGTIILRGHTHIPRAETILGYHIWNPGSLSLPKGGSPRSYALYEQGIFEVRDMADKVLLRHAPSMR